MDKHICARLARQCGLVLILVAPVAWEVPADEETRVPYSPAQRDSLISRAGRQMRSGEAGEAVDALSRLVDAFPDDARLLSRLGDAYLKTGDFESAKRVFETAKKRDADLPDAYVGLGLAYVKRPARGLEAYYNFRRAIGEAKKAIEIDATYGPAYRLLGEGYERFEEDYERAIEYFMKYIELEPDNPDGLHAFGLACVQTGQHGRIDAYITPYVEKYPQETQLIPLAAQAYFLLERYEPALEYFERYLQTLDETERQLYTDIALLASREEVEDYQVTPGAGREAYLEQFWLRRDSDILTGINERVIEHYRRVWYARTFFSNGLQPWDRRGEVYIRYGEPDYRSRSTRRTFVQNPNVQAVRDQMAATMYGAEAALLTFTGPVFPVRAVRSPSAASLFDRDPGVPTEAADTFEEELFSPEEGSGAGGSAGNDPGEASPLDDPDSRFDEFGNPGTRLNFGGYAPLTMGQEFGTVPWEVWTYTRIGGGIEITFTDESGNGQMDFAPIPPPDLDTEVRQVARLTEYAPATIFANTVARIPDHYQPGFLHPPLDFYYDLADFRALEGKTTLEVYYGIPTGQVGIARKGDVPYIHVQCALALADERYTTIHRNASKRAYRVDKDFTRSQRAFIPELLKVEVPPGKYDLQVQIKDLISGHTGVYRQSVEVAGYPEDRLQISDIQLAAAIGDTGPHTRFQKGDVWVVPMPTRNYRGAQKVYAYYEAYNLQTDAFGQTRFKIRYLIRSVSKPIPGALGSVATGLRSLFSGGKPQVSVAYEHTGSKTSEPEYVELDLSQVKPGVNILEVEVEDLVSGDTATGEIRFRYGD